jgi:transposase
MRKGFDTLCGLAQTQLGQDPFSGHLFVFFGKRGDRIKVLWWDRSGFALFYKRLERGTFPGWNRPRQEPQISVSDLAMILEGIEVQAVRRHRDATPKVKAKSVTRV